MGNPKIFRLKGRRIRGNEKRKIERKGRRDLSPLFCLYSTPIPFTGHLVWSSVRVFSLLEEKELVRNLIFFFTFGVLAIQNQGKRTDYTLVSIRFVLSS